MLDSKLTILFTKSTSHCRTEGHQQRNQMCDLGDIANITKLKTACSVACSFSTPFNVLGFLVSCSTVVIAGSSSVEEVAKLKEEIEILRKENAKLKRELEAQKMQVSYISSSKGSLVPSVKSIWYTLMRFCKRQSLYASIMTFLE